MGCRKNSPGRPCCGSTCIDATSLPLTLTSGSGAYAVSIAQSQWSNILSGGYAIPCCWGAGFEFGSNPTYRPTYNGYETQCSSVYGFGGAAEKILVSLRWKASTTFGLTKQTCKCDAQPTAVSQYVLTVRDLYVIWSNVYAYFGTWTPCVSLAFDLSQTVFEGDRRTVNYQTIVRRTYYSTAVSQTLTLTPTTLANCNDTCSVEVFTENSTTITASFSGVSRSITWNDTNNWTVNLTY